MRFFRGSCDLFQLSFDPRHFQIKGSERRLNKHDDITRAFEGQRVYPPPTYASVSDESIVCIKIFKALTAINLDCTGLSLRNLNAHFLRSVSAYDSVEISREQICRTMMQIDLKNIDHCFFLA